MIWTLSILMGVLTLGLLGVAAWAAYGSALRRATQKQCEELTQTVTDREAAIEGYLDQIEQTKTDLANTQRQVDVLRERESNFEKTKQELKLAQEEAQKLARDAFQSLSGEALAKANEQFLALAKKSFESEQKDASAALEQRKQAIEAMLKPIRETLDKHQQKVGEIEKAREGAYHGLRQQLTTMLEAQQRLDQQTHTLSVALKGSATTRGRWGEITLKRIAEMAGMAEHCDFSEQVTIWKGDAQQRPDMVVHMPSDRLIAVDSKSVGANYLQASELSDDEQAQPLLEQHVRDIESRVRELSAKAYHDQLERSPDFVVLFLPGDSFLQPAVKIKPGLIEQALENKVVIATPTTLISLLKVIELGWREEKLAEGAAKVRDLGVELHSRIETMLNHLAKLGKAIDNSVKHFNSLTGSVQRNVVPAARRFEELGAKSSKLLPDAPDEIDQAPRLIETNESPDV